MRILVFGQSGQVASALARQNGDEHAIVCVGRPQADILDQARVARHIAGQSPDLVVNAAAYTAVDKAESDPETAFAVNRDGAKNIAIACASADIPFIHLSTDYVFSGDQEAPRKPEDPTGPQGVYGHSKLAGEIAVAGSHANSIILRTAWVYDQSGSNFPKTMLRLAETRDVLRVVADQFGNPTDAEEIARAILAIADTLHSTPDFSNWGIYHFAGPERISWANFARMVLKSSSNLGGPTAAVSDITTDQYPTAAKRPAISCLDTEQFSQTFGFHHVSLATSINRTMEKWLEDVGA